MFQILLATSLVGIYLAMRSISDMLNIYQPAKRMEYIRYILALSLICLFTAVAMISLAEILGL